MLQPVVTAVGDPFYKITSEALLVTQQLVKVIRPLGSYTVFSLALRQSCATDCGTLIIRKLATLFFTLISLKVAASFDVALRSYFSVKLC